MSASGVDIPPDVLTGSDARVGLLAQLLGLPHPEDAVGRIGCLLLECRNTQHYTLARSVVRLRLHHPDGDELLISAGLGELADRHEPTSWAAAAATPAPVLPAPGEQVIRVVLAHGRIEWLGRLKAQSSRGGAAGIERVTRGPGGRFRRAEEGAPDGSATVLQDGHQDGDRTDTRTATGRTRGRRQGGHVDGDSPAPLISASPSLPDYRSQTRAREVAELCDAAREALRARSERHGVVVPGLDSGAIMGPLREALELSGSTERELAASLRDVDDAIAEGMDVRRAGDALVERLRGRRPIARGELVVVRDAGGHAEAAGGAA